MSGAEEVKLQIKVTINKEKNKVLFAEAGSDFTDVLLSFLLLPLGTIMRVLKDHYGDDAPLIGSLNTLYNGVDNLEGIHFETRAEKERLLSPRSHYASELGTMRFNISSPNPASSDSGEQYSGILTHDASSFTIGDDLQLMPNVAGSIVKTLTNLGITPADMDGAERRTVTFGLSEVMALLKGSLVSKNPLSAILFNGSQLSLATPKYEHGNNSFHQINKKVILENSKKMILTVMSRKSTNELLFAQADHDFINFLFGLLTLPLGRAEWYLDSNSGLENIDNLHRSLGAYNFGCSLTRKGILELPYWSFTETDSSNRWSFRLMDEFSPLNFSTKESRRHVSGSRMYKVSDDLTVSPLCLISSLAELEGMNIALSDVEEMELEVGLKEGLRILKAALTSETALTDGLVRPMLMRQPKQEN